MVLRQSSTRLYALSPAPADIFEAWRASSNTAQSESTLSVPQRVTSLRQTTPYLIPLDSPDGPISGWRFQSSTSLESTSSFTKDPNEGSRKGLAKLEQLLRHKNPSTQDSSTNRGIGTWLKNRFKISKWLGRHRRIAPTFEMIQSFEIGDTQNNIKQVSNSGLEVLITEVAEMISESFPSPNIGYEVASNHKPIQQLNGTDSYMKVRSFLSVLAQPSNSVESLRIEEAGALEKVVQWRSGMVNPINPGFQVEAEPEKVEKENDTMHEDNLSPVVSLSGLRKNESSDSRSSSMNIDSLRFALLHSDQRFQTEYRAQGLFELNQDNEASIQLLLDLLQSELDSTVCSEVGDNVQDPGVNRSAYRKRCLQALRHISTRHQVLPSSLMIQDVRRDGNNPVAGGGFADIWRGNVGNQTVCLKVLRLVIEPDERIRAKIRKQFSNEALLWRQLKHPNILPLLGVNAELFNPSFCLISPWMANKDIVTFLKGNPMHNRHKVLLEIAAGLSYLHSRDPPIVHADIRGANILVRDDCRCCLADFGLALITADSQSWSTATTSTMKGAIRWMAPELIRGAQGISVRPSLNQTPRDIYAFGCTVVEIFTLQLPFHDQRNDAAVLYSLLNHERPRRPKSIWCSDEIWSLMTHCWKDLASARPRAQDLYEALQQSVYADLF